MHADCGQGLWCKNIYNTVRDVYDGDCVIPLNPRNKKNPNWQLPAACLQAGCNTRTERIIQTADTVKNTAVRSRIPRMTTLAYVLMQTILTAGKIAAARNTLPSPMITVCPSTVPAFLLKKSMLCVLRLSVTTQDLREPNKSVCGFVPCKLRKIFLLLHILRS